MALAFLSSWSFCSWDTSGVSCISCGELTSCWLSTSSGLVGIDVWWHLLSSEFQISEPFGLGPLRCVLTHSLPRGRKLMGSISVYLPGVPLGPSALARSSLALLSPQGLGS